MRRLSHAVSTAALCGLSSLVAAQSAPRPMTVVDLIDVPGMRDVRLSPDASQILYLRTDADWKQNRTISHIWRINADGSGSAQMTNGEKGESSPRWSPDGGSIAFTARRGDDKHSQIYLISNGGGEARRLTTHATGVSSIQWSPDGARIYFVATDDKTPEEKARAKVKDNVMRYESDRKNRHLWHADVASGTTTRITEGAFSVHGYRVSRDGAQIAHHRSPGPLIDDTPGSEIWLMGADGGSPRRVTENGIAERGAALSPDRQHVLFVANTNDRLEDYYYNNRLFVAPATGGSPRAIVAGGELNPSAAFWSADGKTIFFSASSGVRQNLYAVPATGGNARPVTQGDQSVRGVHYAPSANVIAFTASTPTTPGDIQLLSPGSETTRQVTHLFDDLASRFRLPRVEAIQWKGEDGVEVEGLLYYPLDHDGAKRHPLVVQTHGGPASADRFGFPRSHNYEPVLCALGYFVFKPNYRGSTGYGDAFLRDMVGNYFNQAHKDVMTGVDALIERGLVDGNRMAKMGWSAGGHMTNKIITFTNRFKAAASGAGAINWVSMYGQSDVRVYRTPWFGGTPWQENAPIDQYLADSPLFEIHKVKTPTIVLVGENDARVPMAQSVELYRALKSNGVPTELYVAPKQGHGWRELQQRLFKANVELAWFEQWVHGREYAWERSPVHPADGDTAEAAADK